MRYFIKIVPDKRGELKLSLCDSFVCFLDAEVYYQDPEPEEDDWSGYAKVIDFYGEGIMIDTGRTTTMVESKDLCVVVGAVSNKAIWLKEGMEFSEGDFKLEHGNRYECTCKIDYGNLRTTCKHAWDDHRGGYDCYKVVPYLKPIEFICPTCKTFQ